MKITQADTPTSQMDCHPIKTNWCPNLCHFYAGYPSWHNPPNLSCCYLDDMLSVDGDADAAVENRIRIAWNKFRQLVPLLTKRIYH